MSKYCVANQYIFPLGRWEKAETPIRVRTADNSVITLDMVMRKVDMIIAGVKFHVPSLYQQDSGVDLIIGNNFLNLYQPFTQYLDHISLTTLEQESIYVAKIRKALAVASPDFYYNIKSENVVR